MASLAEGVRLGARKALEDSPKYRYDQQSRAVEGFDATDYTNRAAEGAFALIQPKIEEGIDTLRGEQVGMGRLHSGLGTRDEDRLVRGALENLNAQLAANALGAGRLQLGAHGLAGDFLSGRMDRDTAEENAKRKRRGGFLGGLGAIAGGIFGGVPGAIIGGTAGDFLGQIF